MIETIVGCAVLAVIVAIWVGIAVYVKFGLEEDIVTGLQVSTVLYAIIAFVLSAIYIGVTRIAPAIGTWLLTALGVRG